MTHEAIRNLVHKFLKDAEIIGGFRYEAPDRGLLLVFTFYNDYEPDIEEIRRLKSVLMPRDIVRACPGGLLILRPYRGPVREMGDPDQRQPPGPIDERIYTRINHDKT